MARIKKPKLKKLPRKPKARASLEVLTRYVKRVNEIRSENTKRLQQYASDKRKLESITKQIQSVGTHLHKLKGSSYR